MRWMIQRPHSLTPHPKFEMSMTKASQTGRIERWPMHPGLDSSTTSAAI
jgi:hypothetical protein